MGLSFRMKLFLKLAAITRGPMHLKTPGEARKDTDRGLALAKVFYDKPTRVKKTEEINVEGRNGKIPARVYYPLEHKEGRLLIYFHGGGFVINNVHNYDFVCRRLSKVLGAVVISVEYRLSPEYKFPVPVEDCYDAAKWIHGHAESFGCAREKIILMGDSAGGNLSTVACILARDEQAFKPLAQVLLYPTVDSSTKYPSEEKYAHGYLLTKEMMDYFTNHYLNGDHDRKDWRVSPLLAPDLSNLPPAFVITAGYDPLKDEGKLYAEAMQRSGTKVKYLDYPNMVHGFICFPGVSSEAMQAFYDIAEFVDSLA